MFHLFKQASLPLAWTAYCEKTFETFIPERKKDTEREREKATIVA